MAVAKNPGIGQGRGGGRPRGKTREVEIVQLRLSPHAAELLRSLADQGKVPAWQVVETAILAAHAIAGVPAPTPGQSLAPEAQEIAQEAAAFLEAAADRPAALKALRRAWKQALALAQREAR